MAFQVVVTSIRSETDRIRSFELRMADGTGVPSYLPGSCITLELPAGVLRSYSLLDSGNAPDALRIAVMRHDDGRGGSRFLHEKVAEGDLLRVCRLSTSFDADVGPAPHILIAGGIGITPILSLARHFSEKGQGFHLHYGASHPAEAAFIGDIQRAPFSECAKIYYSKSGGRMDVDKLLSSYTKGSHVFCCGPSGMMDAVVAATAHWPAGTVHFDTFEPSASDSVGRAFRIMLASSGETFEVPPDQSVLSTLRMNGVKVDSQCGQGHCGSCLTPVLAGIPEHRDRVLTEDERAANDLMALCCSRSFSDLLVLDL